MGGAIDPAYSDLLARLYAGVASDRPWQAFLEDLARWMDASFATIIISTPGRRHPATFLTPGADAAFNATYAATLFADDPFQGLPDGQVISYAEFMANLPAHDAVEYRAIMRDSGFDQVLGIDLHFARKFEARFRISRHVSLPEFTAAERRRLQDLVIHLRIAVDLFERLQFAGAEHGVFHSAAQGLGLAVVVLDRSRRIVSTNPLADRILSEDEGLRRRGDELVFARSEHQRTIVALLGEGTPAAPLTRFRIERPAHGDVVITARPLDLSAIHAGTGALALFFAQPGPEKTTDPQTLRDLFGLTMAEARLAAALTGASTLVDTAQALGIAHNTAKVQLRSVFAKTGVHRQAELVALIASLGG
ncbi:helix-turn-helix transcriptional regulator [Novosphingobium sp.]|uniref:helix-turn-helix transcriptional regulator n=1 Tax=Novosphingobium sp. TaxID=1874826 RepID=UPI003D13010A